MKLALLGLGTVGSGVVKVLENNREKIEKTAGEPIQITHIYSRSFRNYHEADLEGITLTNDIQDVLDSDVDAAVEVIGDIDFTYEIIKQFLQKGVHVITANKDLLALHIDEFAKLANENNVQLSYEASCAGGIPIIQALDHGFNANKILRLQGILNGTTNYILTRMTEAGLTFKEALHEASEKGYAEADPTNDVGGFDAQRKISLLSRIAYDKQIELSDVSVRGITDVEQRDILAAKEADLTLKLIGQSSLNEKNGALSICVEPAFLSGSHPLSTIGYEKNAVFVNGDAVGESMLYGPGAGSFETASAVVSDIVNTARFKFIGNAQPEEEAVVEIEKPKSSYYIRFEEKTDTVFPELDSKYIDFAELEDYESTVVITQPIDNDIVDSLNSNLTIQSIYPVY